MIDFTYASSLGLLYTLSWLPPRFAFRLAGQVGRLRYLRERENLRPRVMMAAIRLGVTSEEAEGWLGRAFQMRACDEMEHLLYRRWTKKSLHQYVEVRGLEHLTAALAGGRGAILTSGHFTSIHTLVTTIGVLGFKPMVVLGVRVPPRLTGRVEQWFHTDWREVLERQFDGSVLFSQPPSPMIAARLLQGLRRNEVAIMLVDVWNTPQIVDLDFMGVSVGFPQGAYQIARASGSPLLFARINRGASLSPLVLTIEPPLPVSPSAPETVGRQAAALEAAVRADPATWSSQLFRV